MANAKLTFHPALPKHYSDIASLVSSAEELYLVSPLAQYPWTKEQISAVSGQRIDLTVGMIAKKVVCFGNLYDHVPGEQIFIGNIVVSDDYKGRGLGRALLEHFIDACIQKYGIQPSLSVFAYNTSALLLYTSLGFKPYDVETKVRLDGSKTPMIHMRLPA